MDLIERLRARVAHEKTIPSVGHNAADRERAELIVLLTEAAAALEAAREDAANMEADALLMRQDAERYRWLREESSIVAGRAGSIALVSGAWRKDEADKRSLDAAIDHALGKVANCAEGCGAELAEGQWWTRCGETDMGQSEPALCVECGGDMRRAGRAAIDQAREDAWQPIETAPADGSEILLCSRDGRVGQGYCRVITEAGARPGLNAGDIAAWFVKSDAWGEHLCRAIHWWRPLPTPPAIDQALGKAGQEVGK